LVLRLSFLTLVFSRFSWCASISRDAGWLRRTWLLAHVIKKKKKDCAEPATKCTSMS
jgi:hypothetical protein